MTKLHELNLINIFIKGELNLMSKEDIIERIIL